MSTNIGEVNISLRMSMAAFRQDVTDGGNAASKATKDMASQMGASSKEATGSLALIGEELGIHIPRHLRTFITTIPGVGTALSAAFSSVAVLALIEVIVKVIEKIVEYRDHIAASAEAWDQTQTKGTQALRSLDEQILALQVRLDDLSNNHVAALRDQLKLIDLQTLTQLQSEFTKTGAAADEAFKKMQVGWAGTMLGLGNDPGVKNVQKEFDDLFKKVQELANSGNTSGIADVINQQIKSVMDNMGDINSFEGTATRGGKAIYDALQHELDQLNLLYAQYQKIGTVKTDKVAIDTADALKKANEEAAKLAAELQKVQGFLDKAGVDGRTVSKGGTNPFLPQVGIDASAMANSPSFPSGSPTPPIYGGDKQAKDLLDLQNNINEQIQRGQELFIVTRTAAETYDQELKVLNTLLESGAIDQNTYNRAVTEAKAKYDDLAKGIAKIGDTVGRDIANAALYGGSWSKAFQDIGAEILKVIMQMTVLKALQNANSAAGGGGFLGFFTSIVGGLSGKAAGGPVYQGEGYIVGENGPEFFSPSTSGTIIPNPRLSSGSAPNVQHNEIHFHGVTDADSFRQSESQIAASMAAQMSRHAQRNNG